MEIADSIEPIQGLGMWNSPSSPQRRGKTTEDANFRKTISATAHSTKRSAETDGVFKTTALVSELCQQFYGLGWVSGTGGSVTIKVHDDKISKSRQLIIMSPSGVQKERVMPEDMYVLSSDGFILSSPPTKPYPHSSPKCSECTPVFLQAYEICNAGAVIHSHGIEACLATMIRPLMKEFHITHMEMIKGIKGHGYHDELVIPIIENTAKEGELVESFTEAIRSYPKSTAVLVRNHGVYVWGDTWISAKTQAECYHYLFDAAVRLYQMGIDWSTPDHGPLWNFNRVCSFSGNFGRGLQMGSLGSVKMINHPPLFILLGIESNDNYDDISVLCPLDRKWTTVLQSSDLAGLVFEDVPEALKRWHASGIKVYGVDEMRSIYAFLPETYTSPPTELLYAQAESMGSSILLRILLSSRRVQHLLFGHSSYGDLRKYLSGYFDSTSGCKMEKQTYMEILLTVGVNRPADMLYVTENIQEAFAARAAGLEATLTIQPGNEALEQNHGFRTVESLIEIC